MLIIAIFTIRHFAAAYHAATFIYVIFTMIRFSAAFAFDDTTIRAQNVTNATTGLSPMLMSPRYVYVFFFFFHVYEFFDSPPPPLDAHRLISMPTALDTTTTLASLCYERVEFAAQHTGVLRERDAR